jgi:hypothetical protein
MRRLRRPGSGAGRLDGDTTIGSEPASGSAEADPAAFPDGSGGISIDRNSGIDEDSPQFRAAEKACQKLTPGRGEPQSGPVPQP